MRRHISMDQLARDVLESVETARIEKVAAENTRAPNMQTDLGSLLVKCAEEIRAASAEGLTYAEIAAVAEARRAR